MLSGTNGNTHFGVPEIAFYWINFKNIIALLQQAALLRGPFLARKNFWPRVTKVVMMMMSFRSIGSELDWDLSFAGETGKLNGFIKI